MLVTERVLTDVRSRARFKAMSRGIESADVHVVDDAGLERALASLGPRQELERGGLAGRRQAKRIIAFATLEDEEVFPGYSWKELRNGHKERTDSGVLCQTAVEIQSVVGCPFDCTYCPYTAFVCIRLDVENFVERVAKLVQQRPSQKLYKLNNRSDTLGLEPEYGLARALVKRFARLPGAYLLLYSKGAEVDDLVELDHGGKTIASFTLTPDAIAEFLEVGAPSPAERLAAIGKLAEAGYPIRVRFSPVVPVRGWRQIYRELIERLLQVARPELVTMWTLSMIPLAELGRLVPLDRLDGEALEAARRAQRHMNGRKGAPFPGQLRASIYAELADMVRTASPTTKVSLCLETDSVWTRAGDQLVSHRGEEFVCNCGPRVVPLAALRR